MTTTVEQIRTGSGLALVVEKRVEADGALAIAISTNHQQPCVLHWGLCRSDQPGWQLPPREVWPEGTRAVDHLAVQTPFAGANGHRRITIDLGQTVEFAALEFVLFFPGDQLWDNNRGRNYRIPIPKPAGLPEELGGQSGEPPFAKPRGEPLAGPGEEATESALCYENAHDLASGGRLEVTVARVGSRYQLVLTAASDPPLILHWGIAGRSRHDWHPPPSALLPPGTVLLQESAARTPFFPHHGRQRLELTMDQSQAPLGIVFVLQEADTGRWLKERGGNFFVPLAQLGGLAPDLGHARLTQLADEIIDREMGGHSWTLMHRFNLCYDLLDRVPGDLAGLALLYVWLRYSALRQLDWQRNYNTKPRELSHALERLTFKLADRYRDHPEEREWLRLIMTTLGRGSNGQEVRDEILRIMHRHHIKEVTGHFLEEWHQKLHNNTTPDDVVICEAYLGFLKSSGDLAEFYRLLEAGGVTRDRLQSYERPITSRPDFVPHLRDALIPDFEHFLGILKAVHSGTDLGTAIHGARHLCDGDLHRQLDFIWHHRDDRGLAASQLVETIAGVRSRIREMLAHGRNGARDLLFLDLALEQFVRILVERDLSSPADRNELVALLLQVLENLSLSRATPELARCLGPWRRLQEQPRFEREWSLRAKAVLDRLGLLLADFIDRWTALLQPPAMVLGRAFQAASWTVDLFCEEVIRGQLEFALSALLRRLDPILRSSAELGSWQIISPAAAAGRVEVVPELRQVQGREYARPTVILAWKVAGDEEIPAGVTAIITPEAIDLVSHLAVRARNAGLLFATCFDPETLARLEALARRSLALRPTPTGEVVMEEGDATPVQTGRCPPAVRSRLPRPVFRTYAIAAEEFNEREVGGKSNNLRRLLGQLPKWIGLPRSVAVPFGVFEKVLAEDRNREIQERCQDLAEELDRLPGSEREARLAELRRVLLGLWAPPELRTSLESVMTHSGLPRPEPWEDAWQCLKQVWASKWNLRATLSRMAGGIPHDDLLMAVLIQEVIEADYSFVIHTVDPATGNRDEVYAEVVLGLGEALVGNYPGRALSFTSRKGHHEPRILSYPSKSHGLYGGGLIFRSDSNGEDLAGFAGAGLYDSFVLPRPRKLPLDYTEELLFWSEPFRKNLLVNIALIGTMVERLLGAPQDIEGACCRGQYFVVQTRPQVGLTED